MERYYRSKGILPLDKYIFVSGMKTILAAHRDAARNYFEDGSIEQQACPPLKALLHNMAHDEYEGADLKSEKVRSLFSREAMIQSEWYQARLDSQQAGDIKAWESHVAYLKRFRGRETHHAVAERMGRIRISATPRVCR